MANGIQMAFPSIFVGLSFPMALWINGHKNSVYPSSMPLEDHPGMKELVKFTEWLVGGWAWFFATPLKNDGVKVSWNYDIPNHLVGGWATPLKNMSSSVGMIIPNIRKIKMFQTTNRNWGFHHPIHIPSTSHPPWEVPMTLESSVATTQPVQRPATWAIKNWPWCPGWWTPQE